MNGGKMLWAVDNLFASMDSLQRSSGSFIAFDMGLNLDDQLFRYGVRINRDLVQDLESDKVPSVIGSVGGKPQIELLPWPYAPLLRDGSGHPISKNLDYVLSSFPQSIDTVAVDGIKNHLLLTTSDLSRSLQTPAMVEWKSIKNEEDLSRFTKKQIPVAVLLEGKFRSVFSNRLSKGQLDTLRQMQQKDFLNACNEETKMIVLSDADILLNGVSEQDGPLPMGMNSYTREQFANKEFISNSLFYLTAGADIMGARAKTYQLRLLDKSKLESDRVFWQFVNILMPLAFPFLLALIFPYLRKRKFGYQS
jgi:gliding-associated putative ABC transporter substrate-binding component GldG